MVLIGVQRYNIFLNYANTIILVYNSARIITCYFLVFTVTTPLPLLYFAYTMLIVCRRKSEALSSPCGGELRRNTEGDSKLIETPKPPRGRFWCKMWLVACRWLGLVTWSVITFATPSHVRIGVTTSHDSVCSEELYCLCLRRDIRFFHKFKSSFKCFKVLKVLVVS